MNINDLTLSYSEKAVFSLRALYSKRGYSQYKMSKFEEYDLYANNKDFLISDGVITFTDNGKLMALKPDVTLSIVKNSADYPVAVQKVYYNENVYRASKGAGSFKEIMQVGLECIGNIDDYNICEVITLAAESLMSISHDCVLDISHLGLMASVLNGLGVSESDKAVLLKCIGEKNVHELSRVCSAAGVSADKCKVLKRLVTAYGNPGDILPELKEMLASIADTAALTRLSGIINAITDSKIRDIIRIDFSVVDDINYYNGIVFKGFINGVPAAVLSGGQYDKLMQKMGRKSGAIGFAVYLDMLERLENTSPEYDVDVVLLYSENTDINTLNRYVKNIIGGGKIVTAQREIPLNIKYKQLLKLTDNGVEELENNA